VIGFNKLKWPRPRTRDELRTVQMHPWDPNIRLLGLSYAEGRVASGDEIPAVLPTPVIGGDVTDPTSILDCDGFDIFEQTIEDIGWYAGLVFGL
jgi:hypothetical protein